MQMGTRLSITALWDIFVADVLANPLVTTHPVDKLKIIMETAPRVAPIAKTYLLFDCILKSSG